MTAKTKDLTTAAITAALYAALTFLSGLCGMGYGPIQFRLSEALTILPVFMPAAIPGLAVGCLAANILSTVNPADMLIGTLATLIAAFLTRKLRNVTVSGYPILSFLSPVLINALFVGAEIAFFTAGGVKALFLSFAGVFAGEAAVCFLPGTMLWAFIRKNKTLERFPGR